MSLANKTYQALLKLRKSWKERPDLLDSIEERYDTLWIELFENKEEYKKFIALLYNERTKYV